MVLSASKKEKELRIHLIEHHQIAFSSRTPCQTTPVFLFFPFRLSQEAFLDRLRFSISNHERLKLPRRHYPLLPPSTHSSCSVVSHSIQDSHPHVVHIHLIQHRTRTPKYEPQHRTIPSICSQRRRGLKRECRRHEPATLHVRHRRRHTRAALRRQCV